MKQIVGCLCVFMLLPFANAATTWYVASSGNDSNTGKTQAAALKTIQKAIDKSAAGDTILVSKGTYSYIIVPADKEPLTIRATGSVSDCVIKGDTSKHMRCATLGTESTTNIVLEGFTLTGGKVNEYCDDRRGAGVAYGTANNCVITGNTSGSLSTAAGAYGCTLNSCTISSNTATDWAGGMESCIANDCIIKDNTGNHGAGGAGACILTRCTISKNMSSLGGGGADGCVLYDCYLESNKGYWGSELNGGTAYNCVICANGGSRVATGARCYNCTIYSTLSGQYIWRDTFLYNCIISGEGGTFSVDGDTNWKVNLALRA